MLLKDQKVFLIEKNQKEIIDELNDEEAGIIFKAIFEYVNTKKTPELNKTLRIVFKQFKTKIDFFEDKYEQKCLKNKENIEKYWEEKKTKKNDTNEYDRIQSNTNVYKIKENKIKENKNKIKQNKNNKLKESIKESVGQSPNTGYDFIISEMVNDDEVKEAMYEFLKMRKLIKKPMTDRALKQLITKLYTLSQKKDEQLAILDQSIINNWSSVYPISNNSKKQNWYKAPEPEWLNKEIKSEEVEWTDEQQREFEEFQKEIQSLP